MEDEQPPQKDDNDQIEERRRSLAQIAELGFTPYPHRFDRTHTISQIVQEFVNTTGEELEAERPQTRVAGRIQAINKMGKAAFIRFSDGAELLQIYIKSNEVDERTWALFKLLDLGDFIGTEGRLFRTRTGELSIHAESLAFLSKALLPPPDKYYGLHDIEIRYRQRYADLIANREVRRVFEKRAQVIRLIRSFFDARGYIEVETPMLTPLPTGAAARPFKTHHNALDIDLYARIAPELYLKRLIVGGFEKVYEINRNFRNEGIDRSHNPEFTMLEFYEAYSDFENLVELTESLISGLVDEVCGKSVVEYGENSIDFRRPWKRMTMREAVIHYWPDAEPPTFEDLSTREGILRCAEGHPVLKSQISNLKSLSYGYLLGEVFERVAEARLINPTFITEFPTELSPLSKQSETDPAFVDRFELFISGMEIANAFCEINDPKDQQARFEAQMKLRKSGDDEAMLIDEDYISALKYGMPPTAGEGIGIDRLVMVLTDSRSIRDVILFPHMRPERTVASGQLPVASNTDEDETDNWQLTTDNCFMPYELFIALRYLRARRKQVMISVITVIAISAVAAGVASLIIVLGMMTGFRQEFQTKILSGTAHLNLTHKSRRPIEDYRKLVAKLQTLPHIRAASATLYQRVLIQGQKDTTGAVLKGVDMSAPPEANEVFQFTVEGDAHSLADPETDPDTQAKVDQIVLGRDLAQTIGLKVGDVATVISPEGHLTPVGLAPRYRDFKVAGIFASGLSDYDETWAYISLDAAQRLSSANDVAEVIQMKVDNVDAVKQIGRDVLAAVGDDFDVQDWQQLNAPIYSALSYEKYLSGIALLIVIGIAALNIITVLIMIVMEKHRDIAILKSMGATNRSVMCLFMIQGLLIGVVGMVVGVLAGEGFCYLANAHKWIKLPAGAYALDYLPFHSGALDMILVAAVTIVISFLSTVYPSWSAARLDPVEALRYD